MPTEPRWSSAIVAGLIASVAACGEAQPATAPARRPADASRPDPTPGKSVASLIDLATAAGLWRVVGVAPVPGPAQAVSRDDPALMGRTAAIDPKRLAWVRDGRPVPGEDLCTRPALQRLAGPSARIQADRYRATLRTLGVTAASSVGNAHDVLCDDGNWGPEAAGGSVLFPVDANTLAMTWYDGAVLKLRRVTALARRPPPRR